MLLSQKSEWNPVGHWWNSDDSLWMRWVESCKVQEMGKQAAKKLSNAFEEARSSAFWQRAQGYWEEKRIPDCLDCRAGISFVTFDFDTLHSIS